MWLKVTYFRGICGLLLFVCLSNTCSSQIIKGSLYNNSENFSATISTRSGQSDQIKEFKLIRNNTFEFLLTKTYDTLTVYCDIVGYTSDPITFIKPNKSTILDVKFYFKLDTLNRLETIVLKAQKRYYQKKDTVGYIASHYMDGTERKVKDLLKKLPQVEVNDRSGVVRYKGKEIETITLDGDNLFGSNYTLATKNINVDIIKAVEAIDNYENNDLLKGISEGGKVSLNLVLKENKTDLSGSAEVGLGFLNEKQVARGINLSALAINKNHKSFFTLTSNNVGVNNSPFNFESGIRTSEQQREEKFLSYSVIKSNGSNSNFGLERGNINNQNFGNFNSLIPINKNIKVKLNGFYLRDKIEGSNFVNQILFGNSNESDFFTFDNTTYVERPEIFRGDIDVKYRLSKKSLLSFVSKLQNLETDNERRIESNNNNFQTQSNFNNTYLKNELEFTHKLNDSTVFQSRFHYSINSIPQELKVNTIAVDEQNSFQSSKFSKEYLSFSNFIVGKIGRLKYGSQLDFYSNRIDYNSNLMSESSFIDNSVNQLQRRNTEISNQTYVALEKNQWRFSLKSQMSYLKQNLTNFSQEYDIVLNPSVAIAYALGQNKAISFTSSYSKKPLDLLNSFSNIVLLDNRSFVFNSPSLKLKESYVFGVNYFNNNLFKQLSISSGIQYSQSFGDYFQDIRYDLDSVITRNFYLSESSKNFSSNFSIKKYLDGISSSTKLSLNGNYYQYFNIINDSNLRDNELVSLGVNFEVNTSFDFPVNFGNEIVYNYTENISNAGLNKFSSLSNNSKIIFKSKIGLVSSLSSSFFNPNIGNSLDNIHFLDLRCAYSPRDKNWTLLLTANNLLNNSFYERTEISDFSNSTYQNQLLGRLFMFSFEFSF